ncbi:hypothetical protein K0M31_019430 [Melipona bicolor]|uniref:Uncharacterized protein n=1 Tax=Melipona bicolor TaxID=60889 RepID=A0AA40G2D8_9HYME|nr:hypothetical protein K0M31_019430 [Melipona bicolor]
MPVRILARQSWLARRGGGYRGGGYRGTPRTARQVDVERSDGNARGIGDSTCWDASRRYRLESNAPGLRFSERIERAVLPDLHTCRGCSANGK